MSHVSGRPTKDAKRGEALGLIVVGAMAYSTGLVLLALIAPFVGYGRRRR